nr:MAG TPA: hypothetical protein [Caudoviricetes sp.]
MAILNKTKIPTIELVEEYFKKIILEPIMDTTSLDSIIIPVSDNNLKIKYIEDQLESHLKLMNGFTFSDIPKLI